MKRLNKMFHQMMGLVVMPSATMEGLDDIALRDGTGERYGGGRAPLNKKQKKVRKRNKIARLSRKINRRISKKH